MTRWLRIFVALAIAGVIGALLARGCYPRAATAVAIAVAPTAPVAPIPRSPASSVSGEEPFPEPDLASLRSRAADLADQMKALRARLIDGKEPADHLSGAFENAARLS